MKVKTRLTCAPSHHKHSLRPYALRPAAARPPLTGLKAELNKSRAVLASMAEPHVRQSNIDAVVRLLEQFDDLVTKVCQAANADEDKDETME